LCFVDDDKSKWNKNIKYLFYVPKENELNFTQDTGIVVFDGGVGLALNASLIDMGNRFRLIINQVDAVKNENNMPKLPVANVLWKPQPNLKKGAEAWILAGGAHHTSFSFVVTPDQLIDWAEMVGIETLLINNDTDIRTFKNEIRWNELAWGLKF